MTAPAASPVAIRACSHDVPSIPPWFAELILLTRHFAQRGVLDGIREQVRLARGRAGRYDVIDLVALLVGYAASGEPTLEAFFDRLQPFAHPFMALFGRDRLPHRSTLSRCLAAVDGPCLEALRRCFDRDLAHSSVAGDRLGGLADHRGHRLLVIDVDGTRQVARQRALVTADAYPRPRRRLAAVCAPGYLGHKRGEVVRTRTVALQAHTQQWLGTFSGAGNGDDGAELDAAGRAVVAYLAAKGLRPAQALVRLDALYGTPSPLARLQRAGLGFLTRGRDDHLLDHPTVRARLERPCDVCVQHPETRTRRELFEVGYITDWLEPGPELSLTCRVIVARQAAPECGGAPGSGKRVGSHVYELFLTSAPAPCLRADEVIELYHQRGAFERVLGEEDAEQDPDRWCSRTPAGQEFWQIVSQWVWNARLELGLVAEGQALRRTEWTVARAEPGAAVPPPEPRATDQAEVAAVLEAYGPPELARAWGRGSRRFTGSAFEVLADGTVRCPADQVLRPQERRAQADGSVRVVYRATAAACRECALARDCLGPRASGQQPRRVSAVQYRVSRPGGTAAALAHEETLPAPSEQPVLIWSDLPGHRVRRAFVRQVRRQRVAIVTPPADGAGVEVAAGPPIWTRAERAHRRLSWAARLARNQLEASRATTYVFTVCGVAPALATFLGLPSVPLG